MLGYYSVLAFCNYQDRGEGSIKAITKIFNAMGGREAFEESKLDAEKVIDKFRSGKCRYLLGFTETLRFLDRDEYVVQLANLSENAVNEMPLFMTDFISMGHSTSGEKLLDCLDIMEIITDSSFVRDLCTGENSLEYMLPADKTLYPVFAELDPGPLPGSSFNDCGFRPFGCPGKSGERTGHYRSERSRYCFFRL
jgi:hypothetical protein